MANRPCCSIEMEPRTLNQGQLTYAREVAADVFQKMEPKEASAIFIKGMRPIVDVKEMERIDEDVNKDDNKVVECKEKSEISERSCQCVCVNGNLESPDQEENLKEPLSAPF